jgi:UDP-N-acetyl-D-galactosamine dehydrogenase
MSKELPQPNEARIAIIGLGYVGLPLTLAFGQRQQTIGHDIDEQRIRSLQNGTDPTREVSHDELAYDVKSVFSRRAVEARL